MKRTAPKRIFAVLAVAGSMAAQGAAKATVIVADADPGGPAAFVSTADIEAALGSGSDFILDVGALPSAAPNDVRVLDGLTWISDRGLTVQRGAAAGVSLSFEAAGSSIAGSRLTIDIDGSVTDQSGSSLTVSNLAILNAADVTLDSAGNVFGKLSANATGSVTLTGQSAIDLGGVSASSLSVTAGGAITQESGTGVVVDSLSLSSSDSITLANPENRIATLGGVARGAAVTISSTGGMTVAGPIGDGAGDVAITASGGALVVSQSIDALGDNVRLTGSGVSLASGVTVESDTGSVLIDGKTGAVAVAGSEVLTRGSLEITADGIDLGAGSQIGGESAGFGLADAVLLRPSTAGTTMGIGDGATGQFSVTASELGTVRASSLRIGDKDAGAMEVGIWTPSPVTGSDSLTLASGQGITQTGALDLSDSGAGLLLRSGGGARLENSDNDFSNLAARTGGGGLAVVDRNRLRVASLTDDIGRLDGISTAGGNVTLRGLAGGVALAANIDAGAGIVTIGGGTQVEGQAAIAASRVLFDGGMVLDLGGTAAGDFDSIAVSGEAIVEGIIEIVLAAAFAPSRGDSFDVLTAASIDLGAARLLFTNLTGGLFFDSALVDLGNAGQALRVVVTPEPGSLILLFIGLAGLSVAARRRSN